MRCTLRWIHSLFLSTLLLATATANAAALGEAKVADGLREALKVGSERAVASTSQVDGFLANKLIRINTPPAYSSVAKTLRQLGLGSYVDDLEVAMNRAAEKAAGETRSIFWDAISNITLKDAVAILNGGDSAATDYLRQQTEGQLTERLRPLVEQSMGATDVNGYYDSLVTAYRQIPFAAKPAPVDLTSYVTEGTMNGLFTQLAEEEKRIRADPVARTTDLLQQVFGAL